MSSKPSRLLIILSFATIYIVWGSTYLFAAFAIEQIPAFRLCSYRYLIASSLIAIPVFFSSLKLPAKQEIINATIAGFVFMGLGTGGAIWALNFLDTGLTALIIAGEPLIILVMMWVVNAKSPPLESFAGVILGLIGMYILLHQKTLISGSEQVFGIVIVFASMIAWGGGSIFVSKAKLPDSEWINSAIQMFVGGFSTLIISFLIGESGAPVSDYNYTTLISLLYLIVFGSVAAFTAFNFLLRHVSTEKVVTNTYVNPIIAMILGFLFNDELITWQSIFAACVMLLGVFIVNTTKVPKTKT